MHVPNFSAKPQYSTKLQSKRFESKLQTDQQHLLGRSSRRSSSFPLPPWLPPGWMALNAVGPSRARASPDWPIRWERKPVTGKTSAARRWTIESTLAARKTALVCRLAVRRQNLFLFHFGCERGKEKEEEWPTECSGVLTLPRLPCCAPSCRLSERWR